MGCGCGGSARQTVHQARQAQRRDGGSTRQQQAETRVMDGFTWNGPARPEAKPEPKPA